VDIDLPITVLEKPLKKCGPKGGDAAAETVGKLAAPVTKQVETHRGFASIKFLCEADTKNALAQSNVAGQVLKIYYREVVVDHCYSKDTYLKFGSNPPPEEAADANAAAAATGGDDDDAADGDEVAQSDENENENEDEDEDASAADKDDAETDEDEDEDDWLALDGDATVHMNEYDSEKRTRAQADKKMKLQNPLFFVLHDRLSIRNLAKHVKYHDLKILCLKATKVGLNRDLGLSRGGGGGGAPSSVRHGNLNLFDVVVCGGGVIFVVVDGEAAVDQPVQPAGPALAAHQQGGGGSVARLWLRGVQPPRVRPGVSVRAEPQRRVRADGVAGGRQGQGGAHAADRRVQSGEHPQDEDPQGPPRPRRGASRAAARTEQLF
jgi:hypothetical protein